MTTATTEKTKEGVKKMATSATAKKVKKGAVATPETVTETPKPEIETPTAPVAVETPKVEKKVKKAATKKNGKAKKGTQKKGSETKRGRGRPQSATLKRLLAMTVGEELDLDHSDVTCKYPDKPQCSMTIMVHLLKAKGTGTFEYSHTAPHVAHIKRMS